MSIVNLIQQKRREGATISDIAKSADVSRDTVYKYLKKDDFSPKVPAKKSPRKSKLDPYKALIDQWMDEDAKTWRKQRHTARRIWRRLVDEMGADVSESTVWRYVAAERARRREARQQFLDLSWAAGEAQADFGEAEFYVRGIRRRLSFLVLVFPYSNVGFAQVLPAESAECLCEGLKRIFAWIGCVPVRIVFDNGAGAGRRVCDEVRVTDLFGRMSAHFGFAYSFCNPYSGHEKGTVENKVGFIRHNLMVPIPKVWDIDSYNERLLGMCEELSRKPHHAKGECETDLFMEDRLACAGLPDAPFAAVRYEKRKADKQGKIQVGGPHRYSSDPAFAGCELTIELGATMLRIYDAKGVLIASHERQYGDVPTDSTDPASQLALLCTKPAGWQDSKVRASVSDDLRAYMDSLGKEDLKCVLRTLRDEAARSGWVACIGAAEQAYRRSGRIDEASVSVGASRLLGGRIDYDEPVDLSVYDSALGRR